MEAKHETRICDRCGGEIKENLYFRHPDGTLCCDRCYFKHTYLDGVVSGIEATYLATIEAFVDAIDAREHEVANHSHRVTQFALVIGSRYGIEGRDLVNLYCGSLLHDIGKIGVSDAVLLKKGELDPEEQKVMRRHPEIGFGILNHIGYLSAAAKIVLCHHEHYDGSGYPAGLAGEDIPLGARIFAVADSLDALTVRRPYREAISFEEAGDSIRASSGVLFDPLAVAAFVEASEELETYVGKIML